MPPIFSSKKRNEAATIIVQRLVGKGDYEQIGVEQQEDQSRALDVCCEGMMRAVTQGDTRSFRENLNKFVAMSMDEKNKQMQSREGIEYGSDGYTR